MTNSRVRLGGAGRPRNKADLGSSPKHATSRAVLWKRLKRCDRQLSRMMRFGKDGVGIGYQAAVWLKGGRHYFQELNRLDALRRDTRRELKRWRGETTP